MLLGLGLFALALRDVDPAVILREVRGLGPIVLVFLVPQGLWTVIHADAWRRILAGLGHRVPRWRLSWLHASSEAARLTFPGGPAVADSLSTAILRRGHAVPLADVVASVATKRLLVVTSHALYALLALAAAWGALAGASMRLFGDARLLAAMGVMIGLLVGFATFIALSMRGGSIQLLHRVASAIPHGGARRWLAARAEGTRRADERLAEPLRHPRRQLVPAALLLGQWLLEAAETWLILTCLGVPIHPAEAMALEATAATVRSLAFVVPAGLGVQDVGYVVMLEGLFPEAAATAPTFVVLKRAKELVWVGVGWVGLSVHSSERRGKR